MARRVTRPGSRDAEQPLEVAARQQLTLQLLELPDGVRNREQPARLGELLLAVAIGEEAVVPNAVEAGREHVEQGIRKVL